MKDKRIYNILGLFFAVMLIFAACEKEDPVTLEAQNETWKVTDITSTSATLSGLIVAEGDGYTEYGVCLNTATEPTVDNTKIVADEIDGAVYKVNAADLEHLTKYYVRAYVINTAGTISYGEETTFTTLANIATVDISEASNIEGKAATINADVPYDGKDNVTEKGICWATTENPTTEDNVIKSANVGTGTFTTSMTKLDGATTYYVKAYAVNKMGTAYSSQIEFTTLVASPTITTDKTENVTKTTLDVYGTVVVDGGATVTERGFCWATTENPTTAGSKLAASTAELGEYNLTIDNLEPGTEYYIRAYAINSAGTEYGDNLKVKTVTDIQKLYLPGDYQVASGYSDGDWSPDKAPFIMNTKENKIVEGYVYFAGAASFKFTSDKDWDHTNYGAGASAGKLSTDPTAGNLSISEAGLYKLTVDISKLEYTITKVDWRLIGGAVGGWSDGDEVDMIYNKQLKQLVATASLAQDLLKFRANRDWGINYGDDGADGKLEPDGANIDIATAGTYTVMLDLNTKVDGNDENLKLAYTYAVTQWGVIGDAVGGWDNDINMTPDIATNTWTYTGDFAAGVFKFRANDDWAVNLGGTTDALSQDGPNIEVTTAGKYTVVLNLANGTYTMTAAK